MKVLVISVAVAVALLSWTVHSNPDSMQTDGIDEFEKGNLMYMVAAELGVMEAVRCRKGFYNMSNDVVDSAYVCSDIKGYTRLGHRIMGDEKVDFDGATPNLCLRACILNNTGMVNTNKMGINETRLMEIYSYEMSKPGGQKSAFRLTQEIMECDKKHFTTFPSHYRNCTEVEEFLKCSRRVFFDCGEKPRSDIDDKYAIYAKNNPQIEEANAPLAD